jgi:hypothetical protein
LGNCFLPAQQRTKLQEGLPYDDRIRPTVDLLCREGYAAALIQVRDVLDVIGIDHEPFTGRGGKFKKHLGPSFGSASGRVRVQQAHLLLAHLHIQISAALLVDDGFSGMSDFIAS